MLELAEQELEQVRRLLRTPTPDTFPVLNQKLEFLVSFLTSVHTAAVAGKSCDARTRSFLSGISGDLPAIRLLLEGPAKLFEGLNAFRAESFGSYQRTGSIQGFELQSGRTLMHL